MFDPSNLGWSREQGDVNLRLRTSNSRRRRYVRKNFDLGGDPGSAEQLGSRRHRKGEPNGCRASGQRRSLLLNPPRQRSRGHSHSLDVACCTPPKPPAAPHQPPLPPDHPRTPSPPAPTL